MNRKLTPIASAVALLMLGASMSAQAQQAAASTDQSATEQVVVTGIRASKQKSLDVKRNADVIEEVVSAEDIGKMPDKNVADAVERLPGVQVQNGASGTGGSFDEPDRVSIRSTSPSLTSTTINGHTVASGDWFVLDQTGLAGRSVSFDLMPSEIVSRVVVHKDQVASDQEGGAMGNVDIETRKPLDFKKDFTAEASLGAAYSDLPAKTDPQFNGLVSWKNPEHTMGVMLQVFDEDRHLRRDGVEELTYNQIKPTGGFAPGQPAAGLAGVYYPEVISSALFQQERKRAGGVLDWQFKPSNDVELDINGFYSHMDANNLNAGYMLDLGAASGLLASGVAPSSYTVKNGTLTSGTWPAAATTAASNPYGAYNETYSRIAKATSGYLDFDGKFRLNSATVLKTQIGYTDGKGETDAQNMFAAQYPGSGGSFQMNGLSTPSDSVTINPSSFNGQGLQLNWLWGANPSIAEDKESYGKIDFDTQLDSETLTEVKYGARFSKHDRSQTWIGQGPANFGAANSAAGFAVAGAGASVYPGNFGNGLGSGFISNPFLLSTASLAAYDGTYATRDPVKRFYPGGSYDVKENDTAAYVEGKLNGNGWSGNIGLRMVLTAEKLFIPQSVAGTTPGAITTSAFGPYIIPEIDHDFVDVLPSANFKFDLTKNVDLRLSASRTMSRVDYGALGSPISINQDPSLPGQVGVAAGGNPDLKPVRANNLDAEVEWYFAPRSYFSVGLFESDLVSYVGQGTSTQTLQNQTQTTKLGVPTYSQYNVTSPVNTSGNVMGLELGYEQAIGNGFGVNANVTFADAQQTGSNCVVPTGITGTSNSPCDLIGSSRVTYNLGGYYEDAHFSARVAYTYRSDYFNGLTSFGGPSYTEGYGTLAASVGYTFNDRWSVHFDMINLNDPIQKYYAYNKDQPLAAYDNGRQYFLAVNAKF